MSATRTTSLAGLQKSKWTTDEDEQLRCAISSCGTDSWNRIALRVPTRTGKQCRERWIGQLAPSIVKNVWLPDEDAILIRSHAVSGNHWTSIAAQLPGRSAINVKNRWYWLLRHNVVSESASEPTVVERPKTCHAIFEPLILDNPAFGAAFEAFRIKMLMGADDGVN
jgi:hypothetical protein